MGNYLHEKFTTLEEISELSETLVDLLHQRAIFQPEAIAYTFLNDGETVSATYSFAQLDSRARAIAAFLQKNNHEGGDAAILLYPPGMQYLEAFFGCLYAGIIAIPAYPPRKNRSIERVESIIKDSGAKMILTDGQIHSNIQKSFKSNIQLENVKLILTEEISSVSARDWLYPEINKQTVAFIQYTSGSTGNPKGVVLTHGNIIRNQQLIKEAFQHSDKTVFVSWLPLYHDMGLIGNVLQPLYLGIHCVLMPPVAFLQKPIRWLQAMSKYGGTTTGAPNFAYDLCIDKIPDEQLLSLDLRNWDLAYNGSEPIKAETIEKFSEKFSVCGFQKKAFCPCYGLAEATLLVTSTDKYKEPVILSVKKKELERERKVIISNNNSEQTVFFVSSGKTYLGLKLIVVVQESNIKCEEDQIGEIWISDETISKGYWDKPFKNIEVFGAELQNEAGVKYLRTGDLGFIHGNELFVTGRIKDLIIMRGRNYYPQDIELTVYNCHESLLKGSGSAFSIDLSGSEELIVIQELEHRAEKHVDAESICQSIREAIVKVHEISPHTIVLTRQLSIPKTSSGKLQRYLAKQYYLDGNLEIIKQVSFKK